MLFYNEYFTQFGKLRLNLKFRAWYGLNLQILIHKSFCNTAVKELFKETIL